MFGREVDYRNCVGAIGTFKCYANSLEVILNIRGKGAVLNGTFNYYGCSSTGCSGWVIGVIDDIVWDSEEVCCGEVRLGDEKYVNVVIK
jgi:hypothetical protein